MRHPPTYTFTLQHYPPFPTFFKNSITQTNQKNNQLIPNHPHHPISYLFTTLLFSQHYIKLHQFADQLFLTQSTLKNHLKPLNHLFSLHPLSLPHPPKYPLTLTPDQIKLTYSLPHHLFHHHHPNPPLLPQQTYQFIQH
ncbi:helix-turn-helix domain-containing protein, partial [Bacillus altitudinis]|uniref:helix-turn-helix domain-containing protein n=1 Tax=Bacillus altitudinis TaxID=293387 RepID=UPI003B528D8A